MFYQFLDKMNKDKLNTVIIFITFIIFLITIVMFSINVDNAYASDETQSFLTCDNGEVNTYLGVPVCCPSSTYRVNKAGDNYYCIRENLVSNTNSYVGVDIVDSVPVCLINTTSGVIYGEDLTCSVSLGSEWSTIDGSCFVSALEGRNCQCKAPLSVCGATIAGKPYCSNGGILIDNDCQINTYTIEYDANGGSGAPANQTGTFGTKVTIANTKPTKTNYTFKMWEIDTGGNEVNVLPGGLYNLDSYVSNGEISLKAVWVADTYTIEYDANGGSGAPANQTGTFGTKVTITNTKPTKTNYTFKMWEIDTGGNEINVLPGGSYNLDSYVSNGEISLRAVWVIEPSIDVDESETPSTPITYTISYNSNGGSGAPPNQDKIKGVDLTLSSTVPTRSDYLFIGWNTDKNATTATYQPGGTYASDSAATLFAIWKKEDVEEKEENYNIRYELNGGVCTGNPEKAVYGSIVEIKNPTKTVIVVVNSNNSGATIGNNVTTIQEFKGWSSYDINTSTAYYGDIAWTDVNTLVTTTTFKNLTNSGKTVTLTANWKQVEVTLPTVVKKGYTCEINTLTDGKGISYESGGKYIVDSKSNSSINLYAICEINSKTDDEIKENQDTGDILIYIVWIIGLGSLGYSVYYFMKSRNTI